ncbi:hypothetical protein M3Y99_01651100 [Aphelenchoides fujianensis]|nr:hypothetical protein M3Y99_01651100 [Aphelenchoides fujianensis]
MAKVMSLILDLGFDSKELLDRLLFDLVSKLVEDEPAQAFLKIGLDAGKNTITISSNSTGIPKDEIEEQVNSIEGDLREAEANLAESQSFGEVHGYEMLVMMLVARRLVVRSKSSELDGKIERWAHESDGEISLRYYNQTAAMPSFQVTYFAEEDELGSMFIKEIAELLCDHEIPISLIFGEVSSGRSFTIPPTAMRKMVSGEQFDFLSQLSLADLKAKFCSVAAQFGEKVQRETTAAAKKRKRCLVCKKRVGLTGFPCRCGGLYCSEHRYDTAHDCQFDYKTEERNRLAKQMPRLVPEKMQKL